MATLVTGVPLPAFTEIERDAFRRLGKLLGQRGAALTDAGLERYEAFQELKRHLECVEHWQSPLAVTAARFVRSALTRPRRRRARPVTSASATPARHVDRSALRRP